MHWALRFAASVFFLPMVEKELKIAPLKMLFPKSVFYIIVALSIFDIRFEERIGDFLIFLTAINRDGELKNSG